MDLACTRGAELHEVNKRGAGETHEAGAMPLTNASLAQLDQSILKEGKQTRMVPGQVLQRGRFKWQRIKRSSWEKACYRHRDDHTVLSEKLCPQKSHTCFILKNFYKNYHIIITCLIKYKTHFFS